MAQKQITTKEKIYFIYFIAISILILIIFGLIIFGYFWDYRSQIKQIESYYQNQAQNISSRSPEITKYDPIQGPANAGITLFVYSDFFCPSCKNLQEDIAALQQRYQNNLRIVFKTLPVSTHPQNRKAINASYCAWEQGSFWTYKDLLYQNNNALSEQKYIDLAISLGLDMEQFNQCLESEKYLPVIQSNVADALKLEINSVPTIYINNQKMEGFLNFNTITNTIDQQLSR